MSNDSALLGVALICRMGDGPRFAFHYPPRLNTSTKTERPPYGTELDPTGPEDYDDIDSDDDDDVNTDYSQYNSLEGLGLGKKGVRDVNPWEADDVYGLDEYGKVIAPWENLDQFHTNDLASILTPTKEYHKQFFELTLDPLTFVTYPMHVYPDGRWKKMKKNERKARRKAEQKRKLAEESTADEEQPSSEHHTEDGGPSEKYATVEEIHKRNAEMPRAKGSQKDKDADDSQIGKMTMFNLVFIMNPKRTEVLQKIQDMFEHVAKDCNKALRHAQNYSNYVSREAEIMLNIKEANKENKLPLSVTWDQILLKSTLARTMVNIFDSISNNKIAVIRLASEPPVSLSVQIPKPYFISMLPEFDEPSCPGLWTTTANFLGDQEFEDETSLLSKHFALLLLEDEESTVSSIQIDGGELAGPLLEYLKIVKPTLSFHQTAQHHAISLSDIRILAQHLIYHRRAIAISPLHPRDTYILSPNSPNADLPKFAEQWKHKFPLAPPLTTFLGVLSHAPRPYKTFIPIKTHRPVYIKMLAFLLRHGWATQLRTFCWVVAWPEIKYEVEYELEGARLRAAVADANQDGVEQSMAESRAPSSASTSYPQAQTPSSQSKSSTTNSEALAEQARLARARRKAVDDLAAFNLKPKPVSTDHPSLNRAAHLKGMTPQLILDPMKAEHVDSLYLACISRRLDGRQSQSIAAPGTASQGATAGGGTNPSDTAPAPGPSTTNIRDGTTMTNLTTGMGAMGLGKVGLGNGGGKGKEAENRNTFLRWAKYFNGRTSMERIALLEGVKRKEVWASINSWDEFLSVVRTW